MCLNYVPPPELTAARLVVLLKPGKSNKPDGVRPIAIGESLTRLLSSLIFNRISTEKEFPELRIVAYMDDISIIGSYESICRVSNGIAAKYKDIGLALNPEKCPLIGRTKQSLLIDDDQIPFINYEQQEFKFLGCWLGNLE
ncbi:hypothetical protein P9112_009326 [Eukaryota sp. TZLM1-RC]